MSSEGSVSSSGSRIRQFGLYRSIDARTEEFLRLSRKRQIRQGCACAAVSTAITVTVVVVVIFIYEFSIKSEVNLENSLRTNWFSLINDTSEVGFETKYTKSNFDKTTLTLLPILLKALQKNEFLEKILEEQSSSSPTYEKKETTEYSLDKNVFPRNWFRIPSSKFYAIAYKTSPIAYYKSPSKNLDYFTKVRKVRDYKRIMNYVDKMISEKVYIGSTKPMVKEEAFSEKPSSKTLLKTTAKSKYNSKRVKPKSKSLVAKDENNNEKKDKALNCKCPMNLGKILQKILSSIEILLPGQIDSKKDYKLDCNHHNVTKQYRKPSLNEKPSILNHQKNITSKKINKSILSTPKLNDGHGNIQQKSIDTNKDSITPIKGLLQRNSQHFTNSESSSPILNKQVDATEPILSTLTKPMMNINKYNNILNQKTTLNFFQNNYGNLNKKKKSVQLMDKNENDVDFTATIINDLFDTKQLELLKDKAIKQVQQLHQESFDNHIKVFTPVTPKKPEIVTIKTTTPKNYWLMNLNKTIYQIIVEKDKNTQNKTKLNETTMIIPQTTSPKTKPYHVTNSDVASKLITNLSANLNNTPLAIEEEIDNVNNLTQEDLLKSIESSINPPTETNVSVTHKTELIWEELKNENIPAWKSMMPNHKPIYLEIQKRNDWNHDEQDFDFNVINNYEIPDQV